MKFETLQDMTFTCENCAGWDIDKSELRNSINLVVQGLTMKETKEVFDEEWKKE